MKLGYLRANFDAAEQDEHALALREAGAEDIYVDRADGRLDERPQLAVCLERLQAGDTLLAYSAERLGRTPEHLARLIAELGERGVGLRVLQDAIDTTVPNGDLVFKMMTIVAGFEHRLLIERNQIGFRTGIAMGRRGGRPRVVNDEGLLKIHELREAGKSYRAIAAALGVSAASVLTALRREQEEVTELSQRTHQPDLLAAG